MHNQIGTPEDVKVREQQEREKLLEIEGQLKAYKQSRLHHLSSPENSQVCIGKWSGPFKVVPTRYNSGLWSIDDVGVLLVK